MFYFAVILIYISLLFVVDYFVSRKESDNYTFSPATIIPLGILWLSV